MIFTDEQKRMIRDYHPALSDRPPGIDLAQLLEDAFEQAGIQLQPAPVSLQKSGLATVLNTATTAVVAVGEDFDGKPAVALLNEADGAIVVKSATWDGSGNLTITLSAAATADRTVAWFVDGR